MIRFRGVAALALAIVSVLGFFAPAKASTLQTQLIETGTAHGLIIQYRSGVSPVAPNGQASAANAAKVELLAGHGLGDQLFTADFAKDLPIAKAKDIAKLVRQDPRVLSVGINRNFGAASMSAANTPALRALTPASAVQTLKAVDAFSEANPTTASVKLTWKAPAKLYGAKVTGYIVEYSSNLGKSYTQIKLGTALSYTFSKDLEAGTPYKFRVRAITKLSTASKSGLPSAVVGVTPTTAPQAPLLTSGSSVSTTNSPAWVQQSISQQGGLAVTYTASATLNGQTVGTCTTIANTCVPANLTAGVTYVVDLVATNKRGSVHGITEIKPADEYYSSQWYLFSEFGINLPKAWQVTRGSRAIVVAVLDSGITKHPDLDGQLVAGYDFVSNKNSSNDGNGWDADPSDPGDYYTDAKGNFVESSWHGTHVAGIIAAASNTIGVTGIAPNVLIQPVRAMGTDGGTSADLIAAINWAAGLSVPGVPMNATPAKVINMSMGTSGISLCDDLPAAGRLGSTGEALKAAKAAGVTSITAAGNFNTDARYSYPGNCYPTINVGATGFHGERAYYSNYTMPNAQGVGVDISAPGGDDRDQVGTPPGTEGQIQSTYNDGQSKPGNPTYGLEEGTSMAAPVVAGVVALLYSIKPTLTFDEAWTILSKTVSPFKAGGQCATSATAMCGVGIVNAGAAVALLKSQN